MIAESIINKLKLQNKTIAIAESVTGGGLSFQLVNISGASKVFKGSLVTYQKDIKTTILKVGNETIEHHTIVSTEVAIEMAKNIKEMFNANIGVGITGNAGPEYEQKTNEKVCYIAIAINDQTKIAKYLVKNEKRADALKEIIAFALKFIFNEI